MTNYTEWATKLLEELYYTPEEHRVAILTEHLNKVHLRGARDGDLNGWWKEQDEADIAADLARSDYYREIADGEWK